MKILVVDDKEGNRKSAEKTLEGHELTIVGSYEEAMNLMQVPPELRRGEPAPAIPFDAVLTDMMMPMGNQQTLAPRFFKPTEQVPYGFIIALKAAMRGAKYVAMVTDTNHHAGAMSAALDAIDYTYYHAFPGEEIPKNPPNLLYQRFKLGFFLRSLVLY